VPSRIALFALALSIIAIANDFTALNVMVPTFESEFDVNLTTAQWVLNAYALVFAMLIVPGGRLCDLFGRTRMFTIGTTIFVTFSVVGAAAPDIGVLIAARALMAVGGAIMWPAVLGMTFDAFGPARAGLAGGFVLGIAGLGNAVGPINGGFFVEVWSWRGVLLLNLPIGALAIAVVARTLKSGAIPDTDRSIDYAGIALLGLALVSLLLALDYAPDIGWGATLTIVMLAVSVVAAAAFAVVERRRGQTALMPPDLASNGPFLRACAGTAVIAAGFFTVMLYVPQVMQKSLDYSALQAGVGMAPLLVTFAIASFISGVFYDKLGPSITVVGGAAVTTVGALLMAVLIGDPTYARLVIPLIVFGFGFGAFQPTVTTAAVTALDAERESLAGGILYMFTLSGGALGLGVAATIVSSVADSVREPVNSTFVDGVADVFILLTALSVLATVLAIGIARASRRAAVEDAAAA
jgi:EmrB/QacA subfamily drug resistance transporter